MPTITKKVKRKMSARKSGVTRVSARARRRRNGRVVRMSVSKANPGPNVMQIALLAGVGVLAWDYFTGALGIWRMFGIGSGNGSGAPLPQAVPAQQQLPPAGSVAVSPTGTAPTQGSPQPRPNPTPGQANGNPAPAPGSTPPPAQGPLKDMEATNPEAYRTIVGRAAGGNTTAMEQVRQSGIRYNSDQWRWFHSQVDPQVGSEQADLFPADNRNYQMTVDEYRAARTQAGLAGLHEMVGAYPILGIY